MIVFVTGPIGAGKSKVVFELSRALELPYASIDDIVADGYKDPWICMKCRKLFGTDDQKVIGSLIFNDEDKLEALEEIFADFMVRAVEVLINEHPNMIFEFPTLLNDICLEKQRLFVTENDVVVYVDCPKETRKERVSVRRGMTDKKFAAVEYMQVVMHQHKNFADVVVLNDGEELLSEVLKPVIEMIKERK